jgi:hypothetical protein
MLTIYAKSLSGEITPLSVPADNTWLNLHALLASIVCPDDPTRLVLLPDTEEKTDELGSDHPQWGQLQEWKDGDSLVYFVNDPPVYQITYSEYPPRMFDYLDSKTPYYLIGIYIYSPSDSYHIMSYSFLFSYKDNTFISQSDFSECEDDEDTYLSIKRGAVRWTSLYEMIHSDQTLHSCYRRSVYRSAHRKWSRMLRRLSQPVFVHLRRRLTSKEIERNKERYVIRELYRKFRRTPPPYPQQAVRHDRL